MNYIMVINAGSSSIKFKLYSKNDLVETCSGLCERIGIDGIFKISYTLDNNKKEYEEKTNFKDHEITIDYCLKKLIDLNIISDLSDISGIGYRIVQGGEIKQSSIIDDNVLKEIKRCIKLAPLHNKPELEVINIIMNKIPNAKGVAVFDTSFHTTIPKINNYYALPESWINSYKIKKYGFHGTSYRYIYEKMESILNLNRPLNLIICHLGNGASICCVKDGKSFDTTMGFTPMAGLVMGTRCGDIDASILDYLVNQEKIPLDIVCNSLNKDSGLKSICSVSDFRDIHANALPGNNYDFARELFWQKVANYISLYINHLEGNVDAIVFTGGIGENDYRTRENVANKIFVKNIKINEHKNKNKYDDYLLISSVFSQIKTYAVRTNEELKIAQDTKELIKQNS